MAMELSGLRPIVIEPPLVGTFCRMEPSNFTIRTGIFVHLSKYSSEIRTAPGKKPCKPAFRLGNTNDDYSDVIVTAVFIGSLHQPFCGNPNIGSLRQNSANFIFGHHAR